VNSVSDLNASDHSQREPDWYGQREKSAPTCVHAGEMSAVHGEECLEKEGIRKLRMFQSGTSNEPVSGKEQVDTDDADKLMIKSRYGG